MPFREFEPACCCGLFRFMEHGADIHGIGIDGLYKFRKVLLRQVIEKKSALQASIDCKSLVLSPTKDGSPGGSRKVEIHPQMIQAKARQAILLQGRKRRNMARCAQSK
jgi:hypothetical protein